MMLIADATTVCHTRWPRGPSKGISLVLELKKGTHETPDAGICLMEYVSLLAGDKFTDRPGCSDGYLAWLARRVNDTVSDELRAQLVARAPALLDTRQPRDAGSSFSGQGVVLRAIATEGLRHAPDDRVFRRYQRGTLPTGRSSRWAGYSPRWNQRYVFVTARDALFFRLCSVVPASGRDLRMIAMLDESLREFRRNHNLPLAGVLAGPEPQYSAPTARQNELVLLG